MKWALVWLFWLFLVKNSQSDMVDEGGGNGDDPCDEVGKKDQHYYCHEQNIFHDHECSGVCHHREFEEFKKDAPEIGKFKKCCDMYSFRNDCAKTKKAHPYKCGGRGNFQELFLTFDSSW